MKRLLILSAAALAVAGCHPAAEPANEAATNITPLDENAADASLGNIVEIPADDGDAPSENAMPPETNAR